MVSFLAYYLACWYEKRKRGEECLTSHHCPHTGYEVDCFRFHAGGVLRIAEALVRLTAPTDYFKLKSENSSVSRLLS